MARKPRLASGPALEQKRGPWALPMTTATLLWQQGWGCPVLLMRVLMEGSACGLSRGLATDGQQSPARSAPLAGPKAGRMRPPAPTPPTPVVAAASHVSLHPHPPSRCTCGHSIEDLQSQSRLRMAPARRRTAPEHRQLCVCRATSGFSHKPGPQAQTRSQSTQGWPEAVSGRGSCAQAWRW